MIYGEEWTEYFSFLLIPNKFRKSRERSVYLYLLYNRHYEMVHT